MDATVSIVALDKYLNAVLCTILDIPLSHVPTLRVAQKMGLLPDMSQIHIAGPPIDTVKASPMWQTATPAHPQDLIGPRWAAPPCGTPALPAAQSH